MEHVTEQFTEERYPPGKKHRIEHDGKKIEFSYSTEYNRSYLNIYAEFPVDIVFSITMESRGDGWLKKHGLGSEHETGDAEFDELFFIQSRSTSFIERYLASPERRTAIMALREQGFFTIRRHDGEKELFLINQLFPFASAQEMFAALPEILANLNVLLTDVPAAWEPASAAKTSTLNGFGSPPSIYGAAINLIITLGITLAISGVALALIVRPGLFSESQRVSIMDYLGSLGISELLYLAIFHVIIMVIAATTYRLNKHEPLRQRPLWRVAPVFTCAMIPVLLVLVTVIGFGYASTQTEGFTRTTVSLAALFAFNLVWRIMSALQLSMGWRNREESKREAKRLIFTMANPYLAGGVVFILLLVALASFDRLAIETGVLAGIASYYAALAILTLATQLWYIVSLRKS